jgi:hypothetical protein
LVDAGQLGPQVDAVLPLDRVREALGRVASRHTRGKIVLQIGQSANASAPSCSTRTRAGTGRPEIERGCWLDDLGPHDRSTR